MSGTVYFAGDRAAVRQLQVLSDLLDEVHVVFDGNKALGTMHFSRERSDEIFDQLMGVSEPAAP